MDHIAQCRQRLVDGLLTDPYTMVVGCVPKEQLKTLGEARGLATHIAALVQTNQLSTPMLGSRVRTCASLSLSPDASDCRHH